MAAMTELTKLNVSEIAARLEEPFAMANVARVGDVVVSVYNCEGMVRWHRHVDIDELFWVYEGTMLLESELGDVRLHPGELTAVPKGVSHRSSSNIGASVLLLRCVLLPDRKNGRRRLYATDEPGLECVNLHRVARAIDEPFLLQTVARINDTVVQVAWGSGVWLAAMPAHRDLLFYVLDGVANLRTRDSLLHMRPGDFTVVPRGAVYHLHSSGTATLVRVTRGGPL